MNKVPVCEYRITERLAVAFSFDRAHGINCVWEPARPAESDQTEEILNLYRSARTHFLDLVFTITGLRAVVVELPGMSPDAMAKVAQDLALMNAPTGGNA